MKADSDVSPKTDMKNSNEFSLSSTDRALDEALRREVNLVVTMTLSHLRQKSKMHLDVTIDEGPEVIHLGAELGQGGFSSVYEVVGEPTLACKVLSTETLHDKERLLVAAADIVREGHFLTHLSHPNIIKLRGVGSIDDMSQYYLLMDRIHAPLSSKKISNNFTKFSAISIVKAMVYLHSLNIIYRDLKVDNIGLDAKHHIILYDFGLAKELKGPHDNGKYKLSGNTGSWAYMAPEVAKGYKYNASVDVYSFGILLWELLSGKHAFEGMSNVDKEARPPFLRTWPTSLETLITECWHWNPNTRPTFVEIEERLTAIRTELGSHHHGNSFLSWIFDGTTKMIR